MKIDFNRSTVQGYEIDCIKQAISNRALSGNGEFTKICQAWLERQVTNGKALLTHSCTAALEMAALLAEIQPGDEVIMPSYTFVSTANAFVLRGGIPVFVDIRPDTLNLDESQLESALTSRTKAIVPVHYAGVGCEMDEIMAIAKHHQLWVIEDAAQGILSTYKGKPLGSFGHLGTISFHETKNIVAGEGGALLINYANWSERAEIIWEKGTNRSQFFRGEVNKYNWVDIGSSYLPSELIAAFLWPQLEASDEIIQKRLRIWETYHQAFIDLEAQGHARRPIVPSHCQHNGHLYYLLFPDLERRDFAMRYLKERGVNAVFHYVPLHSSIMGKKCGRSHGGLSHTTLLSDCLLRLPLWADMTDEMVTYVIENLYEICNLK